MALDPPPLRQACDKAGRKLSGLRQRKMIICRNDCFREELKKHGITTHDLRGETNTAAQT